jgi:SAM-dependent methyltransferase
MSYWDQVAREFDRLYDPNRRTAYAFNRILRRGLFQRAEITCKVIRQLGAPSLLDVGCGSGRNIVSFLQAGAREVTGIDSAAGMLQIARQITGSFGDHVHLLLGDFLTASLPGPYDLVIALGVFDYLHAEALEFLARMRGLAARAVVFSAPGRSPLRMPLRAWRYRRNGIAVHFYRSAELSEMCRRAGLPSFSVHRVRSSGYVVVGWNE